MKTRLIAAFILLLGLGVSACAHVPPEAPELSAEIGKRIAAIKQSHMNLADLYFDEKRQNIDTFIEREWTPVFVKNLFNTDFVSTEWTVACASDDLERRNRFMLEYARVLNEKTSAKKAELKAPLNELEAALKADLESNYRQAAAMNTVLTDFLASASKVDENRQRALDILGADDQRLTATMHKIDGVLAKVTSNAEDLEQRIPEYTGKINAIIDMIKGR